MTSFREHSDVELVRAFLRGEERAFNEIHRRYADKLQSFVYKRIRDREKAEDLVQETFLRISRHIKGFDQTRNFGTWVYTIAGNLAKNEMRNRSVERLVFFQRLFANTSGVYNERLMNFKDEGPLPDSLVEGSFFFGALRLALCKLQPDQRQVFLLREVSGLSHEEIAKVKGCTLTTMRKHLFRSRMNLRRLLASYGW